MTMINNVVSRRQLHTIISREFIKPSSPTPSHLKTYNLSLYDQFFGPHKYMPIVIFYPNNDNYHGSPHDKTLELKNSLSRLLTKYYPFAGRYDKVEPAHVDCNDNGAEFVEASIDTTLSDFLQNSQHEDLDQFLPHAPSSNTNDHLQSEKAIPLMVQVNHFECGGVALVVSMSHKMADASSLASFIYDWAKMTRFCSKDQKQEFPNIHPEFISFSYNKINSKGSLSLERSEDCVTRSFIFPNAKINDLKVKVKAMTAESEQPITNPTRVDVLIWLLYKCAVAAGTKNNSGSFKPTKALHAINIRRKMIEPLPENSIGNFSTVMEIPTNIESELKPESFISELTKQKMQFQGLKNIETAFSLLSEFDFDDVQSKFYSSYGFSSLCGYPSYKIDFGWGNPVKVTVPGFVWEKFIFLIDTPNTDGIEAIVSLGKQDMAIFQSDPELLAFT